ncbi:MAG TPA: hypothetical protein G4O01_08515 [Dehalococcoidia bacterium]|jgi:hypothetical protein|nr:hypothetical protein [Dehalococcoidia bacterium]
MNNKVGLQYDTNFAGGDPFWYIDTCSSEVGFEIVYRPEEIRANDRVMEQLKKAFMQPFGLPSNQYRFEPTFWRIYWDRGDLPLSLLRQCEKAMDGVASANGILVKQNGTAIQIRPLDYLREEIKKQ